MRHIFFVHDPRHGQADAQNQMLALLERRFDLFKKVLDENAVVGYVTDPSVESSVFADADHLWAQSCLAPRIVKLSIKEEWIITNFWTDETLDQFCRSHQMQMVKHVGKGLALLKNPDAKNSTSTAGQP